MDPVRNRRIVLPPPDSGRWRRHRQQIPIAEPRLARPADIEIKFATFAIVTLALESVATLHCSAVPSHIVRIDEIEPPIAMTGNRAMRKAAERKAAERQVAERHIDFIVMVGFECNRAQQDVPWPPIGMAIGPDLGKLARHYDKIGKIGQQ